MSARGQSKLPQQELEISENVWAKTVSENTYYPLLAHLLDVAAMSRVLFENWLRPGLREEIAGQLGPSAVNKLQYIAAIHDIGKCSAIFQGALLGRGDYHQAQKAKLEKEGFYFPEVSSVKALRDIYLHRHEKLGAISIQDFGNFLSEPAGENLSTLAILGHHGTFEISLHSGRKSQLARVRPFIDQRWIEEQEKIRNVLLHALNLSVRELDDCVDSTAVILVSGLLIIADRLASNQILVSGGQMQRDDGQLSLNDPQGWLEKRYQEFLQFVKQQTGLAPEINTEMILGDFQPRGVQKEIDDQENLAIIAEATGAGKTEAALLRHSQRQEALTFLLPTQSTTNAMMKRLIKVFAGGEQTVASLAHGMAFLQDFYSEPKTPYQEELLFNQGLVSTDFTKIAGSKLGAAVNVATIDQMLLAALPVKWTHLRLLLLANAHVVIDEAHLLDPYQVQLLTPILNFLGRTKSRVTVLSATLPNWLENKFVTAYSNGKSKDKPSATFPSIVSVSSDGKIAKKDLPKNRYQVDFELQLSENIIDDHISWARGLYEKNPKARLGIFVNQVDRAQKIARQLADDYPEANVVCLHSRMLAEHRRKVVERLLEQAGSQREGSQEDPGIILVGTQVVEMSLDIDLDFLSTDLAPAPSLIQRFGRQWRRRESTERWWRITKSANQKVHIVIPNKGGEINKYQGLPYPRANLIRAYQFLQAKCAETSNKNPQGALNFPDDVQNFVETVSINEYSDPDLDMDSLDERAGELLRAMVGGSIAIDLDHIYQDSIEIKDFGALTSNSNLNEEMATRFIEYQQGTLILQSDEKDLQDLGALPLEIDSEKLDSEIDFRRAQMATISLSSRIQKILKSQKMIQVETKTGKGNAYFGPLPPGVEYDQLVGLREV